MTKKVLFGSIILTTALLAFANVALKDYLTAALAFAVGSIWLILNMNNKETPNSLFFLFFIGLAIVGSLRDIPTPIMLLAVSAILIAWDLSQLQARISTEEENAAKTLLEVKHLQKLAITASVGFLVALIPVFVQFQISFVILLIIILAIMLALRKSILYLRNEKKSST
ncbi:MAG: hypothetical protein ABI970_00955 [Chloroflexota bacterium]